MGIYITNTHKNEIYQELLESEELNDYFKINYDYWVNMSSSGQMFSLTQNTIIYHDFGYNDKNFTVEVYMSEEELFFSFSECGSPYILEFRSSGEFENLSTIYVMNDKEEKEEKDQNMWMSDSELIELSEDMQTSFSIAINNGNINISM